MQTRPPRKHHKPHTENTPNRPTTTLTQNPWEVPLLNIDAETLLSTVSSAQARDGMREALRAGYDPDTCLPRTSADLPNGQFLFMPSAVDDFVGIKVLTLTPENADRDLPTIQGCVLLFDGRTQAPLATVDGAAITELRTPALSMAGVKDVLQRRFTNGVHMVIFGGGAQAAAHVEAAQATVPVTSLTAVVRGEGKAQRVADKAAEFGIEFTEAISNSPEAIEAIEQAGFIVTATGASEPLLEDSHVRNDAVLVAMGTHLLNARELPGDLLGRSTVGVESIENGKREAGDVHQAIEEGHLTWDDVLSFSEIAKSEGACIPDDRPFVWKSVGQGWEDIVVAGLAYRAVLKDADK